MGNLGGCRLGQLNWALGLFHTAPSPRFSLATRLTPASAAAAPLTMAGQVAGREDEEGGLVGKLRLPHGELRLCAQESGMAIKVKKVARIMHEREREVCA